MCCRYCIHDTSERDDMTLVSDQADQENNAKPATGPEADESPLVLVVTAVFLLFAALWSTCRAVPRILARVTAT